MWTPDPSDIITAEQKAEALAEQARAAIPALTSRQFWLAALEVGVTKQSLSEAASQQYEGKELEQILIEMESPNFKRDYPLVGELAELKGISSDELDDLWQWASRI